MTGEPTNYSENWYVKGKDQACGWFGCMNHVWVTEELVREVSLYKSGPANHKKEVVLKYQCSSEFPGGLVKTLMLDHILEFPVQRSGIRL